MSRDSSLNNNTASQTSEIIRRWAPQIEAEINNNNQPVNQGQVPTNNNLQAIQNAQRNASLELDRINRLYEMNNKIKKLPHLIHLILKQNVTDLEIKEYVQSNDLIEFLQKPFISLKIIAEIMYKNNPILKQKYEEFIKRSNEEAHNDDSLSASDLRYFHEHTTINLYFALLFLKNCILLYCFLRKVILPIAYIMNFCQIKIKVA
ncbi:MAG: hypothetical protein J0G32_01180 [Alphaproteobacteria bacterium]|nr:hypothetical protein [Alphaproteobacteria bacterium]OJV15267.1 MAG: hypothetical protein BGO27_02025 [Alphaproteobacteria bacterium 33-17]